MKTILSAIAAITALLASAVCAQPIFVNGYVLLPGVRHAYTASAADLAGYQLPAC
nr:hypothetical protein [uncultured Albidiferax sp.]